jgi:hypothetical protein
MRLLLVCLFTLGLVSAAAAQSPQTWSYANITTDTTTLVKSGPGVLHSVCINSAATNATIQIYDSTTGSGNKIGLITTAASKIGCTTYDAAFWTGLTIVTAVTTPDLTIAYR